MKSQCEWGSCLVKEGIHELGYLFENVKMPMLYGCIGISVGYGMYMY